MDLTILENIKLVVLAGGIMEHHKVPMGFVKNGRAEIWRVGSKDWTNGGSHKRFNFMMYPSGIDR